MAFFKDLSPYSYAGSGVDPAIRNIGWLDIREPFPKGNISDVHLVKLWLFCKVPVVRTRGFHMCDFCVHPENWPPPTVFHGEELNLGSAEIRVFGDDDSIFACPDLIFHYVVEHSYLPPKSFLRALSHGPAPGTEEYLRRLKSLSLE